MTESTEVSMKDTKAKTVFIAGYEIDASIARTLMDATVPSVKRVVEELAIAGVSEDRMKAAAKATTEAVVGAIIDLLISKAKVTDLACPMSPEGHQVSVDSLESKAQ